MTATFLPATPGQEPVGAKLRCVNLTGPAGRLEALLNEGAPDAPFAALVCHPHPKGGGTMHNKVVYHAMKVLNAPEWGLGWPVLRFNFRGTGLSEGEHDGKAETGDVRAALDWIENEYKRPVIVAGFSFGAAMALRACCSMQQNRADVRALAASACPPRLRAGAMDIPFWPAVLFPNFSLAGTATNSRLPHNWRRWPPPRPIPNSWCSSPAPITFLPASWSRCRTRSPAGSRSNCHDSGERHCP